MLICDRCNSMDDTVVRLSFEAHGLSNPAFEKSQLMTLVKDLCRDCRTGLWDDLEALFKPLEIFEPEEEVDPALTGDPPG